MRTSQTLRVGVVLLLGFAAAVARAQAPNPISTNLSWDHCAGDGRIADRTFACETNTGEDELVLSIVLHDSTRTGVMAWEAMIDITPVAASIPLWWMFSQGSCRQAGLTSQSDWSLAPLPPTSCLPWYGASGTYSTLGFVYGAPDRFFLQLGAAVAPADARTLVAEQEYDLVRLHLRRTRTVGSLSCPGCTAAACIGVGKLNLFYVEQTRHDYFAGGGQNSVTWQGGYVAGYPTWARQQYESPPHTNQLQCTTPPVPARGRTWGVIKALYR